MSRAVSTSRVGEQSGSAVTMSRTMSAYLCMVMLYHYSPFVAGVLPSTGDTITAKGTMSGMILPQLSLILEEFLLEFFVISFLRLQILSVF